MNETLFEDREGHRIGESTYFDDLLYYSISKDTGDVRICTLKLYTREWETVRYESFLFSSSSIAALSSASSRYTDPECLGFAIRFPAQPK